MERVECTSVFGCSQPYRVTNSLLYRNGIIRYYRHANGEVLGLRWSDIDFEKGYLTIRQTLAKIDDEGNYGLVPEVKTAAGFRTVHLPKFFIEYLIEHKKMVQREKKFSARTTSTMIS